MSKRRRRARNRGASRIARLPVEMSTLLFYGRGTCAYIRTFSLQEARRRFATDMADVPADGPVHVVYAADGAPMMLVGSYEEAIARVRGEDLAVMSIH